MKYNPENGAWQIHNDNYEEIKNRLIGNGYKVQIVEEFDKNMKPKVKAWTKKNKDKFLVRLSYTKPSLRENLYQIPERVFDILENIWEFPIRESHAVSALLEESCDEIIGLGKDASFPESKKSAEYIRI